MIELTEVSFNKTILVNYNNILTIEYVDIEGHQVTEIKFINNRKYHVKEYFEEINLKIKQYEHNKYKEIVDQLKKLVAKK